MPEPLRIALVAEGPTDRIVLAAILKALLPDRRFVLIQIQPETSAAFGEIGTGWGGVYRWCRQAASRRKGSQPDPLLLSYDLLVIHVDADVADKRYSDLGLLVSNTDLPCACACPPAARSVDALRRVMLKWLEIEEPPEGTVLWNPSKSVETWLLAAMFPNNFAVRNAADLECIDPAARLKTQSASKRIKKSVAGYRAIQDKVTEAWPQAAARLSQAQRFKQEFMMAVKA